MPVRHIVRAVCWLWALGMIPERLTRPTVGLMPTVGQDTAMYAVTAVRSRDDFNARIDSAADQPGITVTSVIFVRLTGRA